MKLSEHGLQFDWRCPSNIAIVKYWGKKPNQIPCNASLSMTLQNAFSDVHLRLTPKKPGDAIELTYFFEGSEQPAFAKRIAGYLHANADRFPLLKNFALEMDSTNSFPHSTGIASSASAFGAIALAMLDAQYTLDGRKKDAAFTREASDLARRGSGSASRSVFPGFALWGAHSSVPQSSNEYAVGFEEVHPDFATLHDAIAIIDAAPKKVSSSAGHGLMNGHPYAKARFEQANARIPELLGILKTGDFDGFAQLTESEALTLHAMMLTSASHYMLIKPQTVESINRLWEFRKETGTRVCFTLDAGPNLHILYAKADKKKVDEFLKSGLSDCVTQVIYDHAGSGPERLSDT